MPDLKQIKNCDYNITKIENKILNLFSEINKHYSIILINLVNEKINTQEKEAAEKNLSAIMKVITNIQKETVKLKATIITVRELVKQL